MPRGPNGEMGEDDDTTEMDDVQDQNAKVIGRAAMLDLSSVLQRVREHQSIVEKIEHSLSMDPEQRALRIGLGSARRRAQESAELLRKLSGK